MGLHPQPPAGAAVTALLVLSLVSEGGLAVAALRPGRDQARLNWSSPLAFSGSVILFRWPVPSAA